jgi:hypothetical protein
MTDTWNFEVYAGLSWFELGFRLLIELVSVSLKSVLPIVYPDRLQDGTRH